MKGILNNDEINNITIQDIAEYAKLNNVDVAELSNEESERIMNEIKLNKKQKAIRKFVNEHHITTEGKPRKIYAPSSENGLWYTQDPNNLKNKIRGKSEDIIYQKLYEIYADASQYTIEAWYKIGVDYRKRKSNPRQSTFDRHERTKKTYFTEEFLSMDIRDITSSYIWNYIRDAQEEHQMSLSEVKQLKGTLNLVFEAASDPEIGCRDYNPITTINPMGLFKNNAKALVDIETKKEFSAFSDEQIATLRNIFQERINENRTIRYDRCKYALMGLLASYTGMRASELPALKWEDIKSNHIHLHQMQVRHDGEHGENRFEIVPWLKEEKGCPRGGRIIPFISPNISQVLDLIKEVQANFGIVSEMVFPDSDSLSYERSLYKICKKLGYNTTNNHAFRKGFNMWMLSIGLNVADRARILGHSTVVNLEKYTVIADNWIENTIQKTQIS